MTKDQDARVAVPGLVRGLDILRLFKRSRPHITPPEMARELGIPRSTYVGNGTALSIRSDLGTLNLSDVPVAMLEVGNMRNSSDAHRMTTRTGRTRYARAVVRGIRLYLAR